MWLAIQDELTQTTIPYDRTGIVTVLYKYMIVLIVKPFPPFVDIELGNMWLSLPFQYNELSSSVGDLL